MPDDPQAVPREAIRVEVPPPFSAHQFDEIVRIYKPKDLDQLKHLLSFLIAVVGDYRSFTDFQKNNGTLDEHRNRLAKIANISEDLCALLQVEPLQYLFYMSTIGGDILTGRLKDIENREVLVRSTLQEITRVSGKLAADTKLLKQERLDPENSGRSLERLYIWEAVFEFWEFLGNKVGFSQRGPIVRIIDILHDALELERPSPNSVKQAVEDHKKGGAPRRRKKPRAS